MKITKNVIKKASEDTHNYIHSLSVDDIADIYKFAKDKYHSEQPVLTDEVFDLIEEILTEKSSNHPFLKETGAVVISKKKVKLPYWLGSMDKVKLTSKSSCLENFMKKYPGPYQLSEKLDGVSALLMLSGEPKLYTRGNGSHGQDISHLIPHLELKSILNVKTKMAIRGELIMSKKNFKKYSKDKANARNLIAGLVNAKNYNVNVANDTDFVVYQIIEPQFKPSEQFKLLKKMKLKFATNKSVPKLNNEILSSYLEEMRKESQYDVDGVVVSQNVESKPITSGNPKNAFAFKMILTEQITEARVLDVIWQPSSYGYLKPRVKLQPVKLCGVTINYATGFNGKYIKDNKIGPGAVVKIIRSGDVIPHILEVTKKTTAKMPKEKYTWSESNIDIILEDMKENPEVTKKIILRFLKKLNIESVSEGMINKFFDEGIDTLKKVLTITKKKLLEMEGIKETMAEKIYTKIKEGIIDVPLEVLMAASNVFGRGLAEKKLILIIEKFPNILELPCNQELIDNIIELEGFQEKTAKKFVSGLVLFKKFIKEHSVIKIKKATKKQKIKKGKYTNEVITFSGVRDQELEKEIIAQGGKISSTVTSNTTLLIVKDLQSKSSKIKKAKELKIKIIEYKKKK